MYGGAPSRQPSVSPSMGRETSQPHPMDIHDTIQGQIEDLAAMVESLQRQAHVAQSEV